MSGAMREKDSADFDLEAFIELFDEALTSDDPSVQKTLQHLMVICALARNHNGHSARSGPLRRMYEDLNNLHRRLERLEVGNSRFGGANPGYPGGGYNPSTPYGPIPITNPGVFPYTGPNTTPAPGTGPATWPGPGPNQIWCGTSTSATSVSLPEHSAVAQGAGATIAERVDDLLKSNYKGSSVGTVNVKIA